MGFRATLNFRKFKVALTKGHDYYLGQKQLNDSIIRYDVLQWNTDRDSSYLIAANLKIR